MPVRNEERHLAEAVRHVLGQDYPGEFELVLAVGPSADRTEQIARDLAAAQPRLTVVANPAGKIPAALNAAVRAARHAVIARVDGHALLPPGYLATAVATLTETGAADAGGVMAAAGVTTFGRAVAWAMTSKAGVGSAAFHTGGGAGPVDSVYLGVYHREAIEQAGGWDEGMLRAEDWDLNYRIRARGGQIWFTPDLRVTYRPRASVRALVAQYFHYGRWRRVIVREHPETASFRYLAPPAAAALVTIGLVTGLAGLAAMAAGGRPPRNGSPPASPSRSSTWPASPRSAPPWPAASRRRCGSGYRSSSPPCTWPGGPASSPARAGCTASPSPTRVSANRTRPRRTPPRPGQNESWTSTSTPCSPPIATTATSCTAGT